MTLYLCSCCYPVQKAELKSCHQSMLISIIIIAPLFQQRQFFHSLKITSPDTVKIGAAGERRVRGIGSIPLDGVYARIQLFIDQPFDELAVDVEYIENHFFRPGQIEGDRGVGIERIRIILAQSK